MMPRILMFAGSLRRQSYQAALIDYMARRIAGMAVLDILPAAAVNLPLFNQDLESDPDVMAEARLLHGRFLAADGVIVASPEYNGSIAPFLKNTFDWISRLPRLEPPTPSAFKGKTLLLSSATTGWNGGIQGLAVARLMFSYMGYIVHPNQICVGDAADGMTDEGFDFEDSFNDYLDRVLREFIAMTAATRIQTPVSTS